MKISQYVRIHPEQILLNGHIITTESTGAEMLVEVYRKKINDYPKFFKSGSYFQRQTYLKVVPDSDPVIRSKITEVDTLVLSTLTHEERVTTIFGTDDK